MSTAPGFRILRIGFRAAFSTRASQEGHAVACAPEWPVADSSRSKRFYSTFLQRGYDMLIHDVSLQNFTWYSPVDRSGLVGGVGETHHGVI
jgi:1-deoxy-D-xylulose-5-phosphate synthase